MIKYTPSCNTTPENKNPLDKGSTGEAEKIFHTHFIHKIKTQWDSSLCKGAKYYVTVVNVTQKKSPGIPMNKNPGGVFFLHLG